MSQAGFKPTKRATLVARCHEIQVNLGRREIPEFEGIPEIGMAVCLALHIRGLPILRYSQLKRILSAVWRATFLRIEYGGLRRSNFGGKR